MLWKQWKTKRITSFGWCSSSSQMDQSNSIYIICKCYTYGSQYNHSHKMTWYHLRREMFGNPPDTMTYRYSHRRRKSARIYLYHNHNFGNMLNWYANPWKFCAYSERCAESKKRIEMDKIAIRTLYFPSRNISNAKISNNSVFSACEISLSPTKLFSGQPTNISVAIPMYFEVVSRLVYVDTFCR